MNVIEDLETRWMMHSYLSLRDQFLFFNGKIHDLTLHFLCTVKPKGHFRMLPVHLLNPRSTFLVKGLCFMKYVYVLLLHVDI